MIISTGGTITPFYCHDPGFVLDPLKLEYDASNLDSVSPGTTGYLFLKGADPESLYACMTEHRLCVIQGDHQAILEVTDSISPTIFKVVVEWCPKRLYSQKPAASL